MSMVPSPALTPPHCPHCGRLIGPLQALGALFGRGHKCPPLQLATVAPEAAPERSPSPYWAIEQQQRNMAAYANQFTTAGMANVAGPPAPAAPDLLARLCGEVPNRQVIAYMREVALLDGEGRIYPHTNCGHGTIGYALLYLEWQGLMRRVTFSTGPLPMDCYARFTLTPAGEEARAELLAVQTPRTAI